MAAFRLKLNLGSTLHQETTKDGSKYLLINKICIEMLLDSITPQGKWVAWFLDQEHYVLKKRLLLLMNKISCFAE